jgi:hypothetical protein
MRLPGAGIVIATFVSMGGPVGAADRLTDPQVKELAESIDRGFETWKDELERRKLDEAVIRSAAGTVDVGQFLKDMEKDIDLVKNRLGSSYSAGPEVTALASVESASKSIAVAFGTSVP